MGPMHHLPELSGLLSAALHYSAGTVLPVSPLLLTSPQPETTVLGGGVTTPLNVSPGRQPTKLGYTVALFRN